MKDILLIFIYDSDSKKFISFDKSEYNLRIINPKTPMEIAVKREIKKRTGLSVIKIFPLNWGFTYSIAGKEFKEMVFIAFVNSSKKSESIIPFKHYGLDLDHFIKKINWKDSKDLLKKVLTKGMKGKVYFNKKERET